jgi:hypothetical protein
MLPTLRRPLIGVLAALVTCALPAHSQERVTSARLTLTPLLGYRTPLALDHRTTVVVPSEEDPVVVDLSTDRGSGGVAGVELDLRLAGAVGVTGGVLYSADDPFALLLESEERVLAQLSVQGPSILFTHADISVRLPDVRLDEMWPTPRALPAGYLFAGPAWIRQDFTGSPLALSEDDVEESWGVHLGYRAQFPISGTRHLVLQASLEDYIPFWNRSRGQARIARVVEQQTGNVLSTQLAYNRTHVLMLNVGLALRL